MLFAVIHRVHLDYFIHPIASSGSRCAYCLALRRFNSACGSHSSNSLMKCTSKDKYVVRLHCLFLLFGIELAALGTLVG